jgi:hypothetical protein
MCSFERPYYKMIPKLSGIISSSRNLLNNFYTDRSYSEYINLFKLRKIKIGPFKSKHYLNCKLINMRGHAKFDSSNKFEKTNFKYSIKEETRKGETFSYSIYDFNEDFLIDSDVRLEISGRSIKFYSWLNFFYSTLDIFIHIIGEYMKDTDVVKNRTNNKATRPSNLKVNDSVIELGDISNLMKKKYNCEEDNPIPIENKDKINDLFSNRKPFILTLGNDANHFMKSDNLEVSFERIKYFFTNNAKFIGNNIQNFDLNNILKYFGSTYNIELSNNKRRFKISFDAFGVDKFKQKNNMLSDFCIEISYILV